MSKFLWKLFSQSVQINEVRISLNLNKTCMLFRNLVAFDKEMKQSRHRLIKKKKKLTETKKLVWPKLETWNLAGVDCTWDDRKRASFFRFRFYERDMIGMHSQDTIIQIFKKIIKIKKSSYEITSFSWTKTVFF